MVKCHVCGKKKSDNAGCDWGCFEIDERKYERLKYGDERRSHFSREAPFCPGCGAPEGGYHHPGCPVEECPLCRKTVLNCECDM